MNEEAYTERRCCTECGRRVRVLSPQLCDACLNGPVAHPPDIKAVECCYCHQWTTQPIWRFDSWDNTRTRPWCQKCVEQSAKDVAALGNILRVQPPRRLLR